MKRHETSKKETRKASQHGAGTRAVVRSASGANILVGIRGRHRLFLPLRSGRPAVPDSLAAAILAGLRYQRVGRGDRAGSLHGRVGRRIGSRRTLREPCHPSRPRLRTAGSRDRLVRPGSTPAAHGRQNALCVHARRSTGPTGRRNHRPAGLLSAGGVPRSGDTHGLHGRDAAAADSLRRADRPRSGAEGRAAVRHQHGRCRLWHLDSRVRPAAGAWPERYRLGGGRRQCAGVRDRGGSGPRQARQHRRGRDNRRFGATRLLFGLHPAPVPGDIHGERPPVDGLSEPARVDVAPHAGIRGKRLSLRSALDTHAHPRHGWQHLRLRHHAGSVSDGNRDRRRPGRQGRRTARARRHRLRTHPVGRRRVVRGRVCLDGPRSSPLR